jgi:hypothetical protein
LFNAGLPRAGVAMGLGAGSLVAALALMVVKLRLDDVK